MGPNSVPAAEKEAGSALGGASGGATPTEEVSDQKDTPAPTFPPSWDEMIEMLRHVPCFTDAEPSSTKMFDFFLLTKRISVNLSGDPPSFVLAKLSFGMPKFAVACIQQLQDCTVLKTAEVVLFSYFASFPD